MAPVLDLIRDISLPRDTWLKQQHILQQQLTEYQYKHFPGDKTPSHKVFREEERDALIVKENIRKLAVVQS